jgi:hypothetical protein
MLQLGALTSVNLYTDNKTSMHVLSGYNCIVPHMHSTNANYKLGGGGGDDDDDDGDD